MKLRNNFRKLWIFPNIWHLRTGMSNCSWVSATTGRAFSWLGVCTLLRILHMVSHSTETQGVWCRVRNQEWCVGYEKDACRVYEGVHRWPKQRLEIHHMSVVMYYIVLWLPLHCVVTTIAKADAGVSTWAQKAFEKGFPKGHVRIGRV